MPSLPAAAKTWAFSVPSRVEQVNHATPSGTSAAGSAKAAAVQQKQERWVPLEAARAPWEHRQAPLLPCVAFSAQERQLLASHRAAFARRTYKAVCEDPVEEDDYAMEVPLELDIVMPTLIGAGGQRRETFSMPSLTDMRERMRQTMLEEGRPKMARIVGKDGTYVLRENSYDPRTETVDAIWAVDPSQTIKVAYAACRLLPLQ